MYSITEEDLVEQEFDKLPTGEYRMICKKAEPCQSKKGDNGFACTFDATNDEGRTIKINHWFYTVSNKFSNGMGSFLKSSGLTDLAKQGGLTIDDMIGSSATAFLDYKKNPDGREFLQIKFWVYPKDGEVEKSQPKPSQTHPSQQIQDDELPF